MNQEFNFQDALEQIKAGASIDGKDGGLAPLTKSKRMVNIHPKLYI